MALNELINQVVDVQIRNVTSNTFSRDLNTILIISKDNSYSGYRVYQDSASMLEDGFDIESYAYNAVRTIFSQQYTPTKVLVCNIPKISIDLDYLTAFNDMLLSSDGWLWVISDLRDVSTQLQLAGLVEENDKMYCAATHDDKALDTAEDTDLASRIKSLSYSRTFCWYDKDLPSP